MERKAWIDCLRGFCMIAILWFHTEVYFTGSEQLPYGLYVQDVLATFFFLSGYLFYKPRPFSLSAKLRSIFRWLFLPYLFFTLLIALPKALVHGTYDGVLPLLLQVASGHASWFIASLIVAEVAFSLVLHASKGSERWLYFAAFIALAVAFIVGNGYKLGPLYYRQNLWHVNEACLCVALLCFGYLFHSHEPHLSKASFCWVLGLLFLMLVALKVIILLTDAQVVFGTLRVSSYTLFLADVAVAVLFLVLLFRQLPTSALLRWTGERSLVYYFFCGGVPLLVSMACDKLHFPYTGLLSLLLVFLAVYLITSLVAFFFYRYTPIVRKP